MKILALSDIHGNFSSIDKIIRKFSIRKIVDFELIVIAGDITHFGNLKEAIELLKPLKDLGVRIFFIPGNCDSPDLNNFETNKDIINIHNRKITLNQFSFYGFGGSTPTPFNTLLEFKEEEIQNYLSNFQKDNLKLNNLITITHDPPFNSEADLNRKGLHVGSKVIRNFILRQKPILHICGHIHEARCRDILNSTVIVNPGSIANGYFALIDLSEQNIDVDLRNIY